MYTAETVNAMRSIDPTGFDALRVLPRCLKDAQSCLPLLFAFGQIADEKHWPEIRALILVVSAAKKGTSSTAGVGRFGGHLLMHRNVCMGCLSGNHHEAQEECQNIFSEGLGIT